MAAHPHFEIVRDAIRYLVANLDRQPSLDDLARHAHLSPHHFQRVFTEWAGVSPKAFLQAITVQALKDRLRRQEGIPAATDAVGLSSTSRTHDHFVKLTALTPGEAAAYGKGVAIRYGFAGTRLGEAMVAVTGRGVCHVGFTLGDRESALRRLRAEWPEAELLREDDAIAAAAERLFRPVGLAGPVDLIVRGTPFQVSVWEALLRIPSGAVGTYGRLAAEIGRPGASRAVGTAVGANPVAVLIPCHRVIREEGRIGGYAYGPDIKAALLVDEISRASAHPAPG